MYPPVPSRENLAKVRQVNIGKLRGGNSLNNKILTRRQFLMKQAEKKGLVLSKKMTVPELEKMLNIRKRAYTKKKVGSPVRSPKTNVSRSPSKTPTSIFRTQSKSPPTNKSRSPSRSPSKLVSPFGNATFKKSPSATFSPFVIKKNTLSRREPRLMRASSQKLNGGSRTLQRTMSATKMATVSKLRNVEIGSCGVGPILVRILKEHNMTKKAFEKLPASQQLKILRSYPAIDERQTINAFFKAKDDDGNSRASSGSLNYVREHFVCVSLYQISKRIVPEYKTPELNALFKKLRGAIESRGLVMVDVKPAGGQGQSHDFDVLLKGHTKYSSMEFKATQTKCLDEHQPWSCTPQFYAVSLKNSHVIDIPNEGDAYIRGWYNVLKTLDEQNKLFTPRGELPSFEDYKKDVYRMERPGDKFMKEHLNFWDKMYNGMRGRAGDVSKRDNIDNEMRIYTNAFLKKYKCKLDVNTINRILKKNITGKDYWLTWSAKTASFKVFKGTNTAFIGGDTSCPNKSIVFSEAKKNGKKIGFDKFILKISGMYMDKPGESFFTLNIYWGNRTMNPCWRFGFVKKQ
ncbi:hypothetical protein BST79_gp127 [Only Syngen Nebraska virus 5]|uniref:hypothetical protein n=1 Tax=Only Syngen Nebraska virus 5 TaxID=1917232 RepID=UPI000901584A|nr:hypothetical protein BST79_gp127 [Only Syngen Nebraska virus 5]APC25640.1 hypothetical protein [Only Syngen Nebraska virus 5]